MRSHADSNSAAMPSTGNCGVPIGTTPARVTVGNPHEIGIPTPLVNRTNTHRVPLLDGEARRLRKPDLLRTLVRGILARDDA
jgi:hypothetical protein